jgi:membrane-associated protease RseP (regulator of RpoE activity)
MYLLGVLVLVLGVLVSIALHEVGHLVPAKLFGVKCTQYMVGFGPTVWSRRVGETEYGVKAIPLGGYVRMIGMFPPKPDGTRRPDRAGRWGTLAEQARQDAQREIAPEDADRLFYQRSVPKRLVIMLGGPVMNLLLSFVFLGVVVAGFGVPTTVPLVSSVSRCITPADQAQRACTTSDPVAPAAAAGFQPGDEIVRFAGRPVTSWAEVQKQIRANTGTPVQIVVRRAGREVPLTVTPAVTQRPKLDENGDPVLGADGKPQLASVGFLGVLPTRELQRQSLAVVPGLVGNAVKQTAAVVLVIPSKMVGIVQSVRTGSAITGPTPGTMSRSIPAAASGTTMSE